MISTLARRLARLEGAVVNTADLPVLFVVFCSPVGTTPPADKATVNGCVWHRADGERREAFLTRVRAEAKPIQPGCGILGFLE